MKRLAAFACFVVSTVVTAAFGEGGQAAPSHRPNFLMIYTDDQRYDALSCVQKEQGDRGRFPWFRTPNMDRLASQGVRFRNAFVTNSLCAPSRACFLTGQYNHVNGVVNNHTEFPLSNITSSKLLADAGYETAYFGKWHHANQKERPGFTYVASYLNQGVYNDCPFNVNGTMTATKGRVDDVANDFLIDWLKKRDKTKPFDAVLGYKAPHDPRTPADPDQSLYEGESLRPVPNLESRAIFLPPKPATSAPTKKGAADYRLDYFRAITSADRSLGRVLDALDELGLADDTVVIFTSDNGYYMGEHGMNDKRSAYDESMRIPFIVRYPNHARPGTVADELVTNVDLAPTLLDFAGVPIPQAMQGASWRGVLEHQPGEWRSSFLYEYFYERGYASPAVLAVRGTDAKLITYPGHDDWTELFDLKADPYETKNLIADPGAKELRERMEAELEKQVKATGYHVPANADKFDPAKPGHF